MSNPVKHVDVRMSKPLAILGRGATLEQYAQYAHLFEKIYLVNPFTEEITKLGDKYFKGKQLVHVVSRGNDCRMRKEQYELFSEYIITGNITNVRARGLPGYAPTTAVGSINYVHFQPIPECMKDRGFPLVIWNDITAILHKMPDLSYEELIKQIEVDYSDVIAANLARATSTTRCWPTTGMFAIDLALMLEHPTVVYLFGFDFYQNTDLYFIGKKKSHQTKEAQELMEHYLRHLVREFHDATFRSVDQHSEITEPNWEILKPLEQ